jgi:putative ABC transport system ATP-binding protein
VQLGERIHHRPNELSGGQRQRVPSPGARQPPCHPARRRATGNLDSTTSEEIMRVFEELATQGQTVVCHHEPDTRRARRRVVVLRDGLIASDETRAQFAARMAQPAAL